MKSIMYHYIREKNEEYPYWNFITKKKFEDNLNIFSKNKQQLKPNDELYYNKNLNILTFDDGFKDHLWVAEKLKRKNLLGIFFISSLPFKNGKILDVHRAHLVLGKISAKIAYEKLLEILKQKKYDNFLDNKNIEKFKNLYKHHNDNKYKKEFKKIINYFGKLKTKSLLLDELCKYFHINETAKSFYLNKKEIKYLSSLGMIIGSHTESHTLLSRLNFKQQMKEIKNSKIFLEKTINKKVEYFCYPYGNKLSYNLDTLKILNKLKFKFGFLAHPKEITNYNYKFKPLELPRFDCNIF
jgi:peptidoglycan/xylan/chitin deacetylase (PgdA/CDA1 family)